MSKPTFVLLHGAWHTPACWRRVTPLLNAKGYEVVAPYLPSAGSNPPTPDWNADVELIQSTVSELAKEKDVVIVMHSFSGMTGGTALSGLDKASCAAKGWKGGVVKLVYINAFLVPEGFQHSPTGTRENMDPVMKTDFAAGIITLDKPDIKDFIYQDLSDAEIEEVAKELVPQSLGSYWGTTTSAAWRVVPTTYVLCTGDRPGTVAAIEYLIKSAQDSEPNRVEKVVRRQVGHSPLWSQPEWTAEMLVEEAGG